VGYRLIGDEGQAREEEGKQEDKVENPERIEKFKQVMELNAQLAIKNSQKLKDNQEDEPIHAVKLGKRAGSKVETKAKKS
jgi:hypothetical protein